MPRGSLRIGILTFHFSENFGAILQAYSLRRWLTTQGHAVEIINYHPSHIEQGGRFNRLWDARAAKANAKVAYLKASSLRQKLFGNKRQAKAFAAFRRFEMGVSTAPLRTLADVEAYLNAVHPPYDMVVLGSDQIWSSNDHYGLDRVYFGDFSLPSVTRRVAYAPSFGRSTVPAKNREALRSMLSRLDGLSCRESSGATIMSDMVGKDVACVPDPTLLLGDFSALIGAASGPAGHVFCYALRSSSGIREVAEWVAGRLGSEVLSPYNPHRRWREIGRTVHPSPGEWVGLLDRAAFVVTNSFHGTVFSILLKKPFLVTGLSGSRADLNERALNLLSHVGLLDRFVENGDLAAAQRSFAQPIDWDAVTDRLTSLQAAGRSYLLRATTGGDAA